jgi:hypothetical protein
MENAMNQLPRIYCDMDGVLCDFAKGAEKVTGMSITKWSYGSKSEKWDPIKNTPKFWHTLPWMDGGKELWNFISKYKPHILSAYVEESFDPNCIPGKSYWAKTNLGITSARINLVKRVQKQNYAKVAGIPAVLIDDYKKTQTNSHKRGGIGILNTTTSILLENLKN